MTWRVALTPTARAMLASIQDRRVRKALGERIDGLAHDPEQQGKLLGGELSGLRSLRAAGSRYRIIYRLESHKVVVQVIALGLRRDSDRADIYELARKLLRYRIL